jgi:hypothetical protein
MMNTSAKVAQTARDSTPAALLGGLSDLSERERIGSVFTPLLRKALSV